MTSKSIYTVLTENAHLARLLDKCYDLALIDLGKRRQDPQGGQAGLWVLPPTFREDYEDLLRRRRDARDAFLEKGRRLGLSEDELDLVLPYLWREMGPEMERPADVIHRALSGQAWRPVPSKLAS